MPLLTADVYPHRTRSPASRRAFSLWHTRRIGGPQRQQQRRTMIFGFFRRKPRFPILTTEMIQPLDKIITATEAKQLYRSFVKQIGFSTDRDDIADGARMLGEMIKDHADTFREEYKDAVDGIKNAKAQLIELRQRLTTCAEAEREDIAWEIEDNESDIVKYEKDIEKLKIEEAAFKRDKRTFLIEYINREVQGPDWKAEPDSKD
jgi:hypothetical protein